MDQFQDRVAVVTGGASGIGLALVRAFLAEGMKVVIGDVEKTALDRTVDDLRKSGGDVIGHVTDVAKPDSVEALAEATWKAFGGCHVLCNNAGVGSPSAPIWDTTPNDWAWLLSVNVGGVAHGIQSFVPRMIADGDEGVIMNTTSSNGGITPMATAAPYAASKAGVSALTECLQSNLVAEGSKLRAALFYPSGGLLNTGIWSTARNRPQELAREKPAQAGSEPTFEQFNEQMKAAGMELPVQDLDELAAFALDGIRKGDFVIMIGRETMEPQLADRAKRLAAGACGID
jgi:NAD(P)-dependent dehydrogenase (short-subunit alcohol dehydrogenase family)